MPSDRYDYYLQQSRLHHARSKTFSGNGILKHAGTLIKFSREIGARSAIDYGCGKGNQYRVLEKERWIDVDGVRHGTLESALGFDVVKFDPAVKGFHKFPTEAADLVWCTDVLEHIPEEDISWVIGNLFTLANEGVFVTVGNYPAKKNLPNGENAHVCVKPEAWWLEKFEDGKSFKPEVKLLLLMA